LVQLKFPRQNKNFRRISFNKVIISFGLSIFASLESSFFKFAALQQFKDRKSKFHDSRRRMATSRANKQAMNSFVFENKIKKPSSSLGTWHCLALIFGICGSYI
jgi:hypothetical protein